MSYTLIAPMSREILENADQLPDGELLRIAGALRTLADEVMSVMDRRLGGRPKPHLIVDNTRQLVPVSPGPHAAGHDRTG
jgi:hypothetical protein